MIQFSCSPSFQGVNDPLLQKDDDCEKRVVRNVRSGCRGDMVVVMD